MYQLRLYLLVVKSHYYFFQGKILINTAYGSSKDLNVYKGLGLQKNQIYIVSRKSAHRPTSKKLNATDYQVRKFFITRRYQPGLYL